MECCRETVRTALKKLGFSWKKWRKLLNKANPKQREAFVDKLQGILSAATQGKEQLVYVDEAHIHLDTDEGYGWTKKGERAGRLVPVRQGWQKCRFMAFIITMKARCRFCRLRGPMATTP